MKSELVVLRRALVERAAAAAGYEERDELLAALAEQHQDEPVADRDLVPLYAHANPGEVERLREEIETLRSQLGAEISKCNAMEALAKGRTEEVERLEAQLGELVSAVNAQRALNDEISKTGRPPHSDYWNQSIDDAEGRITAALAWIANPSGRKYCGEMKAGVYPGVYVRCGKVHPDFPDKVQECPDCASTEPSAPVEIDERAAFEEAYERGDLMDMEGPFDNPRKNQAFAVWQARAALERKP